MKPFGAFYMSLTRDELYHPTAEQLDDLRRLCEAEHGVAHDAPYAEALWARACELLGKDGAVGSVGYVWRCYGELTQLIRRAVEAERG